MLPKTKLSNVYIFVSVLLFIARGPFERSKACADRKPIVNSKSVIFSRKLYLILSIKGTYVTFYQFITSLATKKINIVINCNSVTSAYSFLREFANLPKATVSFVISVCSSGCVSVRPHGAPRLPLDGFLWNLICEDFRISVEKFQVSVSQE